MHGFSKGFIMVLIALWSLLLAAETKPPGVDDNSTAQPSSPSATQSTKPIPPLTTSEIQNALSVMVNKGTRVDNMESWVVDETTVPPSAQLITFTGTGVITSGECVSYPGAIVSFMYNKGAGEKINLFSVVTYIEGKVAIMSDVTLDGVPDIVVREDGKPGDVTSEEKAAFTAVIRCVATGRVTNMQ